MSTTQEATADWYEIDPAFYSHGGNCLSEYEMFALADCQGERVLVSPANGGEEALSLVNMGADVSVFDTEQAAARARALAEGAGLKVKFLNGTPGSAEIPGGPYDTVYSTFGILNGLQYFDDWAAGIAEALKPSGRLVIHDAHPMSYVPGVHKGIYTVANSYFGEGPNAASWNIGDLVSALGLAGLATIHLEETPDSERYQTPLDRFRNVRWDVRYRLPGAFVLVAFRM